MTHLSFLGVNLEKSWLMDFLWNFPPQKKKNNSKPICENLCHSFFESNSLWKPFSFNFKMSDHHHSSSIQGSNKKSEETYGWKAKLRFSKENLENQIEKIDWKFDDFRNEIKRDMKALLTQMVLVPPWWSGVMTWHPATV